MNTRRSSLAALSIVWLSIFTSVAFAQTLGAGDDDAAETGVQDVRPPAPSDPGKPSVMIPYALVLVLGGAAVGLSILPSQRTHHD